MREKIIYAQDFMDAFYIAAAGQDPEFIKCVEMVMADMVDVREFGIPIAAPKSEIIETWA